MFIVLSGTVSLSYSPVHSMLFQLEALPLWSPLQHVKHQLNWYSHTSIVSYFNYLIRIFVIFHFISPFLFFSDDLWEVLSKLHHVSSYFLLGMFYSSWVCIPIISLLSKSKCWFNFVRLLKVAGLRCVNLPAEGPFFRM